jgi:hypothetical protein
MKTATLARPLPACPVRMNRARRHGEFHLMCIPHIGTSHVTQRDMEILSDLETPGVLGASGYGAFVFFEDWDADDFDELSPAAVALFEHLAALGYSYARLSECGDVIAGMPTFDW